MFDFLTLSVVIDDKIFCVHGGMWWTHFTRAILSNEFHRIVAIDTFHRPDQSRRQIPRLVRFLQRFEQSG